MRANLVFAALLCFTTWMGIVHATHTPLVNCCERWSNTEPPLTRIANYNVQSEGICPIAAIRFHTTRGKKICSNPKSDWAIRAKAKVDEENVKKALQERGQTEEGSTSTVTPAEPTPAEPTPAGPTPAGSTPAEPTPAGPIPAGSTPAEPTPAGSTPAEPIPAEPTTSKKAPQKKGRKGRRLLGRYSRKWRKRQLRRRG